MCGRFSTWTTDQYGNLIQIEKAAPSFQAIINFAPGIATPYPTEGRQSRNDAMGIFARYLKTSAVLKGFTATTINARVESVRSSKLYSAAFQHNRCLIPATGWYEWQRSNGSNQPFFIRPTEQLFAFAGIWSFCPAIELCTFSIITQPAEACIAQIHHRQPMLVKEAAFGAWLNGKGNEALESPETTFSWHPVTKQMGSPRYQAPDANSPVEIEAVEEPLDLFGGELE